MGLSLIPIEDEIIARLRELPQTVYENGVPDDASLQHSNGVMLPFIAAFFGGYSRALDGRGIISSRHDLGESYVIIQCVGPTERSSRQVADMVRNKMTGFIPGDAGEMVPSANSRYVTPDFSSRPARYISEVTFRYAVNTNVVS